MGEKHKLDVLELKCVRSVCRVTRLDRWENEEMSRRADVRGNMTDRVDQKILRRFRGLERRSKQRLAKIVYDSEVEGKREGGRACTR